MSKVWYKVVLSCDRYWKSLCEFSGMAGEILTKESTLLGGYSSVVTRLMKQEVCLRNHLTYVDISFDAGPYIEEEFENGGKLSYTLVEPVSNGFCIKLSKVINSPLTLLRIEGSAVRVCGYLENIFPRGFFCILWCTSTFNSVLLHGNNSLWVEFYFPAGDFTVPPVVNQWDSTLVPVVYNQFSRCKHCLLVAIVSKKLNDKKLWEFNFFELRRDQTKVLRYKVAKEFLPDPKLKDHPLFGICKIHIYSSGEPVGDSTCRDHKMLVQFGSAVVQFDVRKLDGYEISDPVQILCPSGDTAFFADEKPLGKFALSQDEKLVALMVRGDMESKFQSHIWNLERGSCWRVVTHSPVDHSIYAAEYVAVGHLYHLVMLKKPECIEVCVQRVGGDGRLTQVITMDTSSNQMEQNEFASAHSCGDERWLSSLSGSTSLGVFYISKVSFPHGIRALIRDIKLLRYGV